MAGKEGEQVARGCFQAEADPAGRRARAELLKAGEERFRRSAYGGAARSRLATSELAEIDFLIGAIESDDQGKGCSRFAVICVHGSVSFDYEAATPRATLTQRRQYRRVLSQTTSGL